MAQTINTNVMSLNAQRNLSASQSSLATSMQRLSSGIRVNSAKDDAAGMAIAERMSTQVRGLNVAVRNANDGISLSQIAEGALGKVAEMLQRIRELAVQASNATNSDGDRAALNQEAQELIDEVQRLSRDTEFNGMKLLDGSFTTKNFQIGANEGQQLAVNDLANVQTSALGISKQSLNGTKMGGAMAAAATAPANAVAAETDLLLSTEAGTSSAITWSLNASAKDIAARINTGAGNIGVQAAATNTAVLSALGEAGTVTFTLGSQPISAVITDTSDLTPLMNAINGYAQASGVTASFNSPPSKDAIKLTAADGSDISIENFTSSAATTKTISVQGAIGSAVTLTGSGGAATDSTTIVGTVELRSTKGAMTWQNAGTDVFASATGTAALASVASVDLGTDTGAINAMGIIDGALDQVNSARATLGAMQSRFESAISNIQLTSENLSAARGRIIDADFAMETANLSRAQILQQAGTAMVAQANALPQQVLQLLQR